MPRSFASLKSEELAKAKSMLTGRQKLFLIYREFDVDDNVGVCYDLSDLMKVKCAGDHALEAFLTSWDKRTSPSLRPIAIRRCS